MDSSPLNLRSQRNSRNRSTGPGLALGTKSFQGDTRAVFVRIPSRKIRLLELGGSPAPVRHHISALEDSDVLL